MPAWFKPGFNWQKVDDIHVKVSGVWREIISGWVKVDGVWRPIHTSMKLTLSDDFVESVGMGALPCGDPGTTPTVTCTAVGGTPPYTYSWWRSPFGPDSGPYMANAPTQPTTSFKDEDNTVCESDLITGHSFACDVTDATGQTVRSPGLTVNLLWNDTT